MDFWDLVKVMWRRWYVTAPMLLVTAIGATWIFITVGPEYRATGHVAVVPPEVQRIAEAGQVNRVNPWNEEALAHAASIRLQSRRQADQIVAAGFGGEWSVEMAGTLPVITVEVVAPTAQQAMDTMHQLQAVVEEEVRVRQAEYDIADDEQIMTVRYDQGESIETTASRLRRTLVAVVGAGLVLTTGVVVAFDAVARWHRSRSQEQQPATAGGAGDQPRRRYAYAASAATPVPHTNGTTAVRPGGGEFPLRVKLASGRATETVDRPDEPVPSASASPAAVAGETPRPVPDDSTIVLPLSQTPWAGRPNGDRAGRGGGDQGNSTEIHRP